MEGNVGRIVGSFFYICRVLRQLHRHIAVFFLGLLTVTWFPSGLFHEHLEDVHAMARITHDRQHRCELDAYSCPVASDTHCGHDEHLQKQLTHCHACDFHFIKEYERQEQNLLQAIREVYPGHADSPAQQPVTIARSGSARAPPALA